MKTLQNIFATVVLSSLVFSGFAQLAGNDASNLNKNAYRVGEKLTYRLHYGFLDAGIAHLEVKQHLTVNNKNTYHILGTGRSTGTFSWFFKVRDMYETFIDTSNMAPILFNRDVNEGGYTKKQHITFNHETNTAISNNKTFKVPQNIQDILSAFYYTRCIDYSDIKMGEMITVITFLDDEIFPMKIRYGGKATVKTKLGKFNCLKFTPMLQEGRIFKAEEDMTIYVSDDKNHIPVSIQADILFGSIKADLSDYKNLVYPIAKLN
jgi:hypothetical protein